jgi:3-deoxy-D-manno-octulosonic-acid transferase
MSYLLNFIYLGVMALASPWLLYQAVTKRKYREGFREKFFGLVPRTTDARPCLWLHAVSVGEVNLLATFLKEFDRSHPDWQCVISTTTMTGMALAKKKHPKLTVFYCPLDFSWATRTAMRRVRPQCVVLTELELWPNLVRALRKVGARVAIVNARLSEKSFRGYRRVRWLLRPTLDRVDVIAVQNAEYAERFLALGAKPASVRVTGSMKFDGAQMDRNNPATRNLASLAGFTDEDIVFLAGSTQEPEEQLAVETFKRLVTKYPRLRLVIVPRHPERFDTVAQMLDASDISWQRRTNLRPDASSRVLLVDAVGELGAWWGTATIGFVGGSLGTRGGQNMIEPAAYGTAVSFGPNTWNFRDIVSMLLTADAAIVVNNGDELTRFVERCLEEPAFASELGQRARQLVATQVGATRRTIDLLAPLLASPTSRRQAA